MKREELLNSKEYWLSKTQIDLFNEIEKYMQRNGLNRTQLAEKLGVSKGYISQILNGDADHRISKLVELSLAIGMAPRLSYEDLDLLVKADSMGAVINSYKEKSRIKRHGSGELQNVIICNCSDFCSGCSADFYSDCCSDSYSGCSARSCSYCCSDSD